jgi:AraC-like DNA-binding protein
VGAPDANGIDLGVSSREILIAQGGRGRSRGTVRELMPTKLAGTIYTYPTHALYVGPLIAAASHRHHAGQLVWAPDGVDVTSDDGAPHRVVVHIVPPHRSHSHGDAKRAAVLWVDRDDVRWDRATRDVEVPFPESQFLERPRGAAAANALADALLAWLAPPDESRPARHHPAVVRMRRWLDADPTEDAIHVTELAAQSGLSARQLRHRFTEQMGINPSGYLRWRRLRHAIASIERGASLTEGALEGGFSDGAHFSRVFRAQFGLAPSRALSSLGSNASSVRVARR